MGTVVEGCFPDPEEETEQTSSTGMEELSVSASAAATTSAAGMARPRSRASKEKLDRIFGGPLSTLSRDECGDQAEGRAERSQWERWLHDQKPPHYDY